MAAYSSRVLTTTVRSPSIFSCTLILLFSLSFCSGSLKGCLTIGDTLHRYLAPTGTAASLRKYLLHRFYRPVDPADWHVDDLDKRWKMKDVEYTVHIQYNLCCQSPFRSLHAGRIPNLNDMVACSIPRMVLARRKQKLILLADACHLRLSYPVSISFPSLYDTSSAQSPTSVGRRTPGL